MQIVKRNARKESMENLAQKLEIPTPDLRTMSQSIKQIKQTMVQVLDTMKQLDLRADSFTDISQSKQLERSAYRSPNRRGRRSKTPKSSPAKGIYILL